MQEPEKIIEMEKDDEDHSMKIPTVEQLLDEPAEEFVVTADETKSLDVSESAGAQKNQNEIAEAKKPAEEFVVTADETKSLDVSELAGAQKNQNETAEAKKEPEKIIEMEEDAEDKSIKISTVEQLLDKVDKQNKAVQETSESTYDTESEIKVVKSYFTSRIPKLQDQIMHGTDESVDYESMPEDHLDHICEEVNSIHSKLGTMESSIIHQVSDEIKSTLPALVTTALKEQLYGLLSATLKDCLPLMIQESSQTHIQASSE
uniref:Uncharacterized protein n=1 Tax=Tanacetum cinerariifolium TaxID=118510 RepID=A0A6L2KSC9_TANCI|nr:hypothetical protein [Tanacetum cinerariifolium]